MKLPPTEFELITAQQFQPVIGKPAAVDYEDDIPF